MNVWNSNSGASPWGNHQPQQPFQNASAPGMGGFFQSFQPQNFVAQQPQAVYVPQQPQMQQQMAYGRAGLLPAPVEPVAIVHAVPAPVPAPVIQPHPQFRGGLLGTRPALLHNPGLNRPSASAATTRAFFSAAAAPPPPPPPPPGPPPKSPARPPPPPPPPQDEDMDLDRSREEERPVTPEEDLGEEEKAFKREFSEWEKKYEAWKEQNKNHPDKGAYQRYEAEWNTWRAKLLEKKESMRKDRFRKRAAAGLPPTSVTKDRVQPELVNVRNDRPSSAGIKDRPVPEKEVVEIASLIDPDDDGGNETGQFWSRQRKRTGSSLWLSGGRNAERNADESEAFPLLSARPAEEKDTEKVPQMTEESLREPSLPAPSPERAPSPVPVTVAVAKIVGRDSSDSEDDTENSVSSQRESSNSTPNRRPLLPTPNPAPGIGNSDLKAILATLHAAEKPSPPAAAAPPPHTPPPAAAPTPPPPPPPPPVDKQVKKTLLPTPVEVVDLVEEPARNQEQPMDLEEDEGSLFERRGHSMEQEAAPFSFGKGDFDARVGVQPQNPFFGGDVDQRDRDERFPPFAARNQAQGGPRFNAPVGVLSFQQGPSQGFPQVQPLMQPNFPQQQQAAQPRSLLNIAPQHQQQVPLSNPNVLLLQQQQQQMFNNPNMRPDQQKQQQPMPFNNPNVHPEQQQQPMPFNNPNVHPEQQQQMPFNNPRILLQQQMPFNNPNVRPQQPWIDPREDDWPSIDKMRRMKELMKRRVEAEKELELDSRGNTPDYEDEEEDFDRGGKRSYLEEYEEKILPAFQNSPWWLSYHRDNLDHKSILDPEPDLDTDPNVHVYDEEDEELLVAKMKEPPVVKKENWDEDEEEVSQAKQGYEEEDQEVSGGDEEFDMRFRDSPWLPYHLEGTVHPSYTAKETRKEMGAKAPEWADSPWRDLHESDLDYPYESELQRLKRMAAEPLPYKPVNFDQYDIDALLADKRLPDAASAPVRPVAVGRTMPANVARPPGPNLRAEATKVWVEEYGEFVEFKNYTDRGLAPPRAARWSPKRGRNRMSFSPEPIPSSAPRMVQIPHPTDRWSPRRGNNRISLSPGDLSPISDDEGGRRTEAVRRYPEGRPHPPMVQIDRRPTSRERERERERERPRDNRDYRRQRSPAERGLSPEAMKDAPAWSYRQKEQRPRDLDREHDREWCQRELSRQEEKDRIFGNHWGSRKEAKSPSVQESPSPRNRGREESRGYRRPRSRTRSRSRMSRSRSRSRSDSRDRYRKKEYAPRQTPTSNRYQRCSKSRSPSRCASPSRRPSRWDDGNSSRQKDTTQEQRQAQLEKERKDKEDKQKSARQQLGSQWFDDALHELETGVLGPLADLVVPPPPSLKGVKFPAPAPQVVQVEVEEEEDEIIPPPPPSLRAMMMAAQAAPAKSPVIGIEELILPPGRNSRAGRIVVILRGPPGSGKSHVAKLIKDKEVEFGANAPRICGLDDYFMTEVDQFMTDENGRRTKTKVMKYEYEPELEESYRQSLVKAFKKTVDDGYFPFIIVDCIHDRVAHFEEMASYAKSRGFKVYVIQMEADPALCHRRNLHDRTLKEIESIMAGWEATPASYTVVKLDRLFDEPIEEVEMDLEDEAGNADVEMESKEELDEDDQCPADHVPSKWDCMEHTGEKLDKLDCMRMRKKSAEPETLEDWLQMDVYYGRNPEPGKKRVRWADIEAKKDQMRRRELGFVVGQTNWNDMNDPDFGASALTQTKYFTKD